MARGDDRPTTFGKRRWPPDGDGAGGPWDTAGPGVPPPGPRGKTDVLAYDGWGKSLAGIALRNTLLGLLTLGIYRFWGKTRLRRYLWSHLRLLGDRLEYTGTAKELFLGFLVAMAILIPLAVVYGLIEAFLATGRPVLQVSLEIIWYLLIGFLIGMAIYRAQRYRMTRTLWRGIRFGLAGSSAAYALRFVGYFLLTIVTFGLARPVGDIRLQSFILNNSWFGSGEFRFHGRAADLFWRWALCWFLIPFTFGLSLIWYAALKTRYVAEQTRFQTLAFAMPVRFGDLAGILLPYYLVVAVLLGSLGLFVVYSGLAGVIEAGPGAGPGMLGGAMPGVIGFLVVFLLLPALQIIMVTHRMMKLIADRLVIEGDADLDSIIQNAQTAPKTGEGLADALDVGGGLEIGF